MAVSSFAGVLMTFLLSGGMLSLPLGVPPLPEDPLLAKIAPQECLWYWSSAGMAKPDPKSGNHTEQLLAEKEIQRLAQVIEQELLKFVRQRTGVREEDRDLVEQAPKLVRAVLTRPWAMYVAKVAVAPSGIEMDGGLVVNLGDEVEEVREALLAIEHRLFEGGSETVEEAGVEWHELTYGLKVTARWGIRGRYLVIALGDGTGPAILERARGSVPKWLTELKAKFPIERRSTISYLNVRGILALAAVMNESEEMNAILSKTGLSSINAIHNASGLDATGCVSHSQMTFVGEPGGLFALVDGEPLGKAALAAIPADATIALAGRIDAGKVFDVLAELERGFAPGGRSEIDQFAEGLREHVGIELKADVLNSLGDTWTLYASLADGGFPWTGAVAAASLRDADTLRAANDKVVAKIRSNNPDPPENDYQRGVLREIEVAGVKIYYLVSVWQPWPVAPAWCVSDKHLIVGLFPQAVTGYLSRVEASDSLAAAPLVAETLAAQSPLGLMYVDTQAIFRLVYPLAQIGLQMASHQWQRMGVAIDISQLPTAGAIEKHLRPSIATVSRTKAGIEWTQRQTVPAGSLSGMLPVLAGLGFPAVGSAREAARRTADINTLRQIGIAMHNHHDATKRLPARAWGKEGNRGLSWRVAILPFVEDAALYNEFHLDEPWDSEHNLKLIERMPAFYRSASEPPAAVRKKETVKKAVENAVEDEVDESLYDDYKTRLVTFNHESSVFPDTEDGKGLGLRNMTDGTSKTLMVVQAAPERTVIWTKPDDLEFDPETPLAGLDDGEGFFLALFGDGHVMRISLSITDDIMRSLVTRGGGEAIPEEALEPQSSGHAPSKIRPRPATGKGTTKQPAPE